MLEYKVYNDQHVHNKELSVMIRTYACLCVFTKCAWLSVSTKKSPQDI
jgi:hypothetical protein